MEKKFRDSRGGFVPYDKYDVNACTTREYENAHTIKHKRFPSCGRNTTSHSYIFAVIQ